MDDRYSAALDRLFELVVAVDSDMTGSLTELGLTPSRTHVLWVIQHQGPRTQRELAEALQVSARTITGLVDGLADTGFVTREPHPRDRRATLVTLTAHGVATMTRMQEQQRGYAELLFADMTPDDLTGFMSGMDHVLAKLAEVGVTANSEGKS